LHPKALVDLNFLFPKRVERILNLLASYFEIWKKKTLLKTVERPAYSWFGNLKPTPNIIFIEYSKNEHASCLNVSRFKKSATSRRYRQKITSV